MKTELEQDTVLDFPTIDENMFGDTIREPRLDFIDSNFHDPRANELAYDSTPAFVTIQQSYPRVAQKISLMWGSQELQNAFVRWILTDQEGRQGWPRNVYSALFTLANEHAAKFNLEAVPVWTEHRDKW